MPLAEQKNIPSSPQPEAGLEKTISTPLAFLTLGLTTAVILIATLSGFLSLKETMNMSNYYQNNYALASAVENDKDGVISLSQSEETNRVIVKFKEDRQLPPGLAIAAEKANLEKAQGLNHVLTINGINAQVYEVSEDDTASEVLNRILAKHKDIIEYAEIDMLVPPVLTPNDPYYASAWHLPKIEAPLAWDSTQGENIITAVLDSGADPDHPDLAFTPNAGWDFYYNDSDWSDVYGHGTRVTGAAAAILDNATGVSGVAGKSLVMPIKVANDSNGYGSWSAISSGITYAADNGAKVANLSFQSCNSSTVINAASYMRDKGGVVVVGAGNTGNDPGYQASDQITCVSATGSNDTRPSWSSYGEYIDVAAPGLSIYTTTNGGGYGGISGTSASAPVAAAVYTLIFSANPDLTPAEADSILFSTADDIGDSGYDVYYGHGRVNAAQAVALAQSYANDGGTDDGTGSSTDTESPTVPANLSANNITDQSATLSWSASTDNVGVKEYNVYRDGQILTSTTNTSFTDNNLNPATTYTYNVSAVDMSDNESTQSSPVSVTTSDLAFNIISHSVDSKSSSDATILVSLTKSGTVAINYGTDSNNLNLSTQSTTLNTDHSLTLTNLSKRTIYYYQVVATDQAGNTVSSTVSSFKTSNKGGGDTSDDDGGGGNDKDNKGQGGGKPTR